MSSSNLRLFFVVVFCALAFLTVWKSGQHKLTPSESSVEEFHPMEFSDITTSDGLYRAYIKREEGRLAHIWLYNIKTKERFRLTQEPQPFVGLTFTTDEASITFLSREVESDVIATFDVNFSRGLASVIYNRLSFNPGQLIAMPMWIDDEKLAYISKAYDNSISLMHWSLSRGNHKLIGHLDGSHFNLSENRKTQAAI